VGELEPDQVAGCDRAEKRRVDEDGQAVAEPGEESSPTASGLPEALEAEEATGGEESAAERVVARAVDVERDERDDSEPDEQGATRFEGRAQREDDGERHGEREEKVQVPGKEHDPVRAGHGVVRPDERVDENPGQLLRDRGLVDERTGAQDEAVGDGDVEGLVREIDAVVEPPVRQAHHRERDEERERKPGAVADTHRLDPEEAGPDPGYTRKAREPAPTIDSFSGNDRSYPQPAPRQLPATGDGRRAAARNGELAGMTRLDWILLGLVALSALGGWRRGLIGTALSLAGLAAGAVAGARVAPHVLGATTNSHYAALVGLVGAVVGAFALRAAASLLGSFTRSGLRLLPPLRLLDSLGGVAAGALSGIVLVWVAGAVALQIPGYPEVRSHVEQSHVLRRLNEIAPPRDILKVKLGLVGLAGSALPANK
jgi:hypothetical protein